ncbi:MAG: cobalt ECF transporter T component CbiQ [Candidatus Promineifilaceae bacterium]|jgi:cobalt/nickel transport system permease protein
MHFNTFDHYQEHRTWVHDLDPRVKVLAVVGFVVSMALLPDGAWLAYMLSWGMVMGLALAAGIEPWFVIKRSLLILPFLLAAVTVAFTLPGNIIWQGPWGLTVSDAGLTRFVSIVLRSWISLQMAVLLTATTRFPDLLHALRHLYVPAILVAILAFMYRYLFVLVDETTRLMRARAARSAQLPGLNSGRSLWWRASVAGSMVGQLFNRSLARSDRVYQAMLARGYQGDLLTMNPHQMIASDWRALGLAILLIAALQVAGRLL